MKIPVIGGGVELHDSNVSRNENPNEVEKEHDTTETPNNNMLSQISWKVFKLTQGNESESTNSENEKSSVCSMSRGTQFHFNLDGSIANESIVLGVHSSFEKHPIRVNQLREFKIKQEKEFLNNEQRHLDRLILCSKQVSSEKLKNMLRTRVCMVLLVKIKSHG